jgi:hypothetical protein
LFEGGTQEIALSVVAAAIILLTPAQLSSEPASASAPAFPVLPPAYEGKFLSNLTLAPLAPGSTGTLTWQLANPLQGALSTVTLSFGLYAFNAYPGNATGNLPSGSVPQLSLQGVAGPSVNFTTSSLVHGAVASSPISVTVPVGTLLGDYAIRCLLTFVENGTAYRLASRGYFSAAAWNYATNGSSGPSGNPTLNVSRLNVSGVLPETAVTVLNTSGPLWIYGLLAGAVIATGIGGYYSVARKRGSTSGTRTPPDPSRADNAFGKSRTSDGD